MSIQLKPVPLVKRVADLFNKAAELVNKWAKYKPVHFPAWFMNDEERNRPTTYNGHTLSNGMLVPSYQGIAAFKAAIDASDGENYYTYVPPTGDASSPFRMFDLVSTSNPDKGYDPSAKRPIEGVRDTVTQENYTIRFEVNVQTGNNVRLLDLVADGDTERNLEDYYLGALLVNKTTGAIDYTHINTAKYSSQDNIVIPITRFATGTTYTIYPFLADSSNITNNLRLVPIEGVGKYDYTRGRNFTIAAKAFWLDDARTLATLTYTVTSHVANFSQRMRLEVVNASGSQVGTSAEVSLNLGVDESYSGHFDASNLQGTTTSYRFKMTIDSYSEYINIMKTADNL